METIAASIRRGIPHAVLPVAAATGLRLILEPAYLNARFLLWLGLISLYAIAAYALSKRATAWSVRTSIGLNLLGVNVGYLMIGYAYQSHPGWRADAFVYRMERLVFGRDPQQWLAALQTPWLSTAAMIGYLAFSLFLLWLFVSETLTLTERTGRLQFALMRLYGLGFAGYLLLPAAGPCFHHPELLPVIAHSPFSAALHPWVLGNCSHVDVCPSIHTAICVLTLAWSYRYHRKTFYLFLPFGLTLLLATVYFQYHYVLDLIFGGLVGLWSLYPGFHEPTSPPPIQPPGRPECLPLRR